ncbi:MAG: cell division protein ZapA [Crocinitomicaceae bacterium]|nr:cell division protein ZapA [Crocinitomicaceae bacterium]|tara:strand:- start:1545 stop:1865 length:321 start_codon:yes stop_codon:yes gene_type:complete
MPQETIDISIAGRSYPLTVSPEEVQGIKDAAAAVDERIKELKSQFAVQDRIDLFAMTALQLSIRVKQLESLSPSENNKSEKDNTQDTKSTQAIEDLLQRIQSEMER